MFRAMQDSESHSHTADPRQRHDLSELLRLLRRTNRFEGCVLKYPSPIPPVRLSLTELSSAHERRSGLGRVPRRAVRRRTALLDTCGWRPSFAGHDGRDTRDAGRGGQEAEAAFRSAMEAWAYDEFWRLWDMGSSASRRALSQGDFTDRMRAGTTRPAAGKQVEAIRVTHNLPTLPSSMSGSAWRTDADHGRRVPTGQIFSGFEDGRWTVNLWDFVGLASYFSPDFIPAQPLFVPPPRPPRPKGPTR